MLRKLLTFASVVEMATGLALMIEPRIVVALLVSANEPLQAMPLGRVAGIAVLAFGVACWPGGQRADSRSPAFRAMLIYNALIALYLAYLFTVGHLGGPLLWPAVALHAVVTVLLVKAWRDERRSGATGDMSIRCTHACGSLVVGFALALAAIGPAPAQGPAPAAKAPAAPEAAAAGFDVLKGIWVRPDGGYTIVVRSVGANGQMEAMYYNPGALPFAKAQATRDGATLRVFLELQAGGYGGSTYELTYDPASNRLKGTYYQAVAKQKFDVYFARK